MRNGSAGARILQRYTQSFALLRLHWREYPYFYKIICLCMLCIGAAVVISEYALLPANEMVVYILLAPLGEELVKSSLLVLFLVSFVEYRRTGDLKSKWLSLDSLLFFFLLLYVITIGEVFYPTNPLSGVDLLWLSMKKCAGHFALTVCGFLLFGFIYNRDMAKRSLVLVLVTAVGISVVLHSLVNQIGLQVYLGRLLFDHGVTQEMFLAALFVLSLIFLALFLRYKGKNHQVREPPV